MTQPFTEVMLLAGPYAGTYTIGEMETYLVRGSLRIPVDEHFIISDKSAFAFAVYEQTGIPSSEIRFFWFRKFVRAEPGPFMVEFVEGPLAGIRPLPQPVLGLHETVMIPLKSEPAREQAGRLRTLAVYKNGALLGGEHKLIFDREYQDVSTTHRIIFELSGGPYDGVTYDSDAGLLDQDNAFWANGHYTVTDHGKTGKRFMILSPHFRQALEEYGEEAAKHGGPFPPHVYEVTGKVEGHYEVYVQAKYVGLYQDDNEAGKQCAGVTEFYSRWLLPWRPDLAGGYH